MKKHFFLFVLALCCGMGLRAESGTMGANLSWELNNGTLTISSSGAIPNYVEPLGLTGKNLCCLGEKVRIDLTYRPKSL